MSNPQQLQQPQQKLPLVQLIKPRAEYGDLNQSRRFQIGENTSRSLGSQLIYSQNVDFQNVILNKNQNYGTPICETQANNFAKIEDAQLSIRSEQFKLNSRFGMLQAPPIQVAKNKKQSQFAKLAEIDMKLPEYKSNDLSQKDSNRLQEESTNKRKQKSKSKKDITETDTIQEKRRGRKRERDDLYFIKAKQRIDDLKAQLRNAKQDGMPVKQRQRLRNQVSAQQSRIKRKEESMVLHNIVKDKDTKFEQFFGFLAKSLNQDKINKITNHFSHQWENEEESSQLKRQQQNQNQELTGFDKIVQLFVTKQEELDQFKQNDEKKYDDDSE